MKSEDGVIHFSLVSLNLGKLQLYFYILKYMFIMNLLGCWVKPLLTYMELLLNLILRNKGL